jgi:hypothetical protein
VLFSWNKIIFSTWSCWELIHYTVWNFWWKFYFVFLLYKYHMSITLKHTVLYVVSIAFNTKKSCSFFYCCLHSRTQSATKFAINVHITGRRHDVLLSMKTMCALYLTSPNFLHNIYTSLSFLWGLLYGKMFSY